MFLMFSKIGADVLWPVSNFSNVGFGCESDLGFPLSTGPFFATGPIPRDGV